MFDKFQHAGGIVCGPAESRFVAVLFEQLNCQDGHGDVVRAESDDAFRVAGGARVVLQLHAGFHKSAVNLWPLLRIRIFS